MRTGESTLTHLFNTFYHSGCVPSLRRQGVAVQTYDRGSTSNVEERLCIPTTHHHVRSDKLSSSLLTRWLRKVVSLHNHQYTFRPGGGALDALVATNQDRTERGLLAYVCFFDAANAQGVDAVPNGLLLYQKL